MSDKNEFTHIGMSLNGEYYAIDTLEEYLEAIKHFSPNRETMERGHFIGEFRGKGVYNFTFHVDGHGKNCHSRIHTHHITYESTLIESASEFIKFMNKYKVNHD